MLSLSVVAVAAAGLVEAASETEPPMPGDGTEEDPYEISNASELQQIEENLSAQYVLVEDVTDVGSLDPIGSDPESAFTGTLDGDGHTISGLTIDENADYVGLFGVLGDDSQITDLTLTSVDVHGNEHVGGLAGRSEGGTVHGVTVTGNVSGDSSRIGGLLGSNEKGTVRDSHASVSVYSDWRNVGGLVGANDGWIVHSSADGTVASQRQRVGGLVGWHTNHGDIIFSHATGEVSSQSSQVGGLVGVADGRADITDSYATGDVSTHANHAGGLVGQTDDDYTRIERSYATGNVAGVSSDSGAVGGLVGDHGGHTIEQSYASGSVAANDGVGGLVGSKNGDIIGSFAVGTVSGSEDTGGLVGQNYGTGTVTDSYWDVPATELELSDGGIGFGSLSDTAPAAEMIGENAVANMSGLDFDAIWDARTDPDEYPTLAHERFEDSVPIKSCDVYTEIDVSGVYELQNDISSDETCIEITADDVVLDGKGKAITGVDNPTSGEYAVHVDGATNVTVRNVTVETWGQGTGIYVEQASDVTVRNVEATDNRFAIRNRIVDGFTIDSVRAEGSAAPGLELVDSSNGVVIDVVSIDNDDEGWGGAIRLSERWNTETSNVTLDNVATKHSHSAGIAVEAGDVRDISISNSTVIGSDGSGMVISATGVDVTDSRVLDNDAYGIQLGEDSEATLTNIESRENAETALRVDGSPDVTVEALDIGDSSAANTTLSIAEAVDVELGSATPPDDDPAGFVPIQRYFSADALSDDGLLDVSVGYEPEDVTEIDESTLSLWTYDGDWSEVSESTVDTGEQTVSATMEAFSTVGVFGEGDVSPSASFTFDPDQPTAGQEVAFDAAESSSPNGEIEQYRWDFTGDGEFDETVEDPETTTTFEETDEYTVTLEIEDETGAVDTTERGVVVTVPEECETLVSDGESIQTAIDEAADAETICVEAGHYVESLEITSPLTLRGVDPAEPPTIHNEGDETGEWDTIVIDKTDNVQVADIEITNDVWEGSGIHGSETTNVTVANVDIVEVSYAATFSESSGIQVSNTSITSANIGLANWWGGDFTVTDTVVSEARYGVEFYDGDEDSETRIINNEFHSNLNTSVWVRNGTAAYADTIAVTNNSFVENHDEHEFGVRNDIDSEGVNATNNWWGDENGPSGSVDDPVTGRTADGDGAAVSENVRFDPWLGLEPPEDDPEANLTVAETALDQTDVVEGETVTVTAEIANTGDAPGEYTAGLEIDGTVEDTETVEVEPGETEVVEFTYTFEDAGEYEVSVDGAAAGTVTVSEASTPPPSPSPDPDPEPDISVLDANIEPTTIATGENVTVTVTLENTGDADGDYEVTLNVDDARVDSTTESVSAGETTELSFVHTFEEAGEYEVRVSDVQAGTVTVEHASDELTPVRFDVTDLTTSVAIDEPGDSASISATVENIGDEPDTQTVEVTLDGDVVHEAVVTLETGETHTVSIDLETEALDYGATYEYTVSTQDDSETGVLDVGDQSAGDGDESDADGDGTDDEATDDGVPGFGVTAALLALVSAILLATRGRRSRSLSP